MLREWVRASQRGHFWMPGTASRAWQSAAGFMHLKALLPHLNVLRFWATLTETSNPGHKNKPAKAGLRRKKETSQWGSAKKKKKWERNIGPKVGFYFTAFSFYKLPTRRLPDSWEHLLANILVKYLERKPCVRQLMCEEAWEMFWNWNTLCICKWWGWWCSSWGFLAGDRER